ncbi:hypothetical protein H4R99_001154 [Coemansia sp. RSA 1722]|nr:hypothetical protein LPJ57_000703 [Coemansia sp. RSA 486]KAJ2234942.1 hypothetical protein IWW45_002993 [Coemansia sp. RSA 485]KAJ2602685.1 hypothetical protein GGF39_000563 [Coemansia sp. RSA 1721]KAJ2605425.1 hypothetical protein H4R99_001154 [Coemansia sp. RSA 1722]KAJ2640263.1 hypothetical protein GGF40_000162 [Coemansia sp. RSA 1286]
MIGLINNVLLLFLVLAGQLKAELRADLLRRNGITTPNLLSINGAVLSKNGVATSCEIALLGISAGFVSANCFVQKEIDKAEYGVLFYNVSNSAKPISFAVDKSDIHIHPGYDATTFNYNIAVIEFNKGANDNGKTFITKRLFSLPNSAYILRSVDPEEDVWKIPYNVEFESEDKECPYWSGVYAKNDAVLLCTALIVSPNVTKTGCPVPYSAIYSTSGGNVGILALYSHSVIFGNDTCGDSLQWLNYYTYLYHYDGFAYSVLNSTIHLFDINGESSTNTSDTSLFMENTPAVINFNGKLLTGGNMFGRTAPAEPSQSTNEPSPTSVLDNSENASDAQGLSTGAKIAIGVAVPVVSISLIVLSILSWLRWKRYRQEKSWDPHAEATNINEIANQLAADVDNIRPPPPYLHSVRQPQDAIIESTVSAEPETKMLKE